MSHPWGAVGLLAIQNYILGIKSLAPQNEKVQIKPLYFGDKLNFAKGSYATDKGPIVVEWDKNSYSLVVNIPDNITVKAYIPKCDKDGSLLSFDKKINGIEKENYIHLDNIGSGIHTFKK